MSSKIRRFRDIVASATEPEDKNVIWLDTSNEFLSVMKGYVYGEWQPLTIDKYVDEREERIAADEKLQENINDEIEERKDADNNLQLNIDEETQAREDADDNLADDIKSIEDYFGKKAVVLTSKMTISEIEAALDGYCEDPNKTQVLFNFGGGVNRYIPLSVYYSGTSPRLIGVYVSGSNIDQIWKISYDPTNGWRYTSNSDVKFVAQSLSAAQKTQACININAIENKGEVINTDHLVSQAVASAKIKDKTIGAAKLGDNAVVERVIKDGNVTTSKIADKAITAAKLDTAYLPLAGGTLTGGLNVIEPTEEASATTKKYVDDKINDITSKIPTQATSENQLADKEFVNSSIATNTATFRGTFETEGDLPTENIKDNDYAFIIATDTSGNPEYKRYKYANGTWAYEYTLNNSSFTAEQWAAITSGITKDLASSISNKVDKVSGKGLSTNDYTAAEKTKLAGIEEGAEVNKILVAGNNITLTPSTNNKTIEISTTQQPDSLRYYYSKPFTSEAVYVHHLAAFDKAGKLLSITTNGGAYNADSNVFTPTATAFRPEDIVITVNNHATGEIIGNGQIYTQRTYCYINYNFNSTPETSVTIYLVGTLNQTTGLFTLNQTSDGYYLYVPCNASDITLSNYFKSAKYYIKVGVGNGTSDLNGFTLFAKNDLYYFDGTNLVPVIAMAEKAKTADAATTDGSGNVITDTYATKTELREVITDAEKVEEATAGILYGIDERLNVLETSNTTISDEEIIEICI